MNTLGWEEEKEKKKKKKKGEKRKRGRKEIRKFSLFPHFQEVCCKREGGGKKKRGGKRGEGKEILIPSS